MRAIIIKYIHNQVLNEYIMSFGVNSDKVFVYMNKHREDGDEHNVSQGTADKMVYYSSQKYSKKELNTHVNSNHNHET